MCLRRIYEGKSVRPEMPLASGGNSECFEDLIDLEENIASVIDSILGYRKQPKFKNVDLV